MQSNGGGKHDILLVGRAIATPSKCLWMMPRKPDADMCPNAATASVSTQEYMAHQSYVPLTSDPVDRSNFSAIARAMSRVCL